MYIHRRHDEAAGEDSMTPTTAQLHALRSEAAMAGDLAQVRLCDRALRGSVRAIRECRRALAAAAAME